MVLVGVDFSVGAAGALQAGRALAGLDGSELCVVHVRRERSRPWHLGRIEAAWLREHRVDPEVVQLRHGEPWVQLVKLAHGRSPSS